MVFMSFLKLFAVAIVTPASSQPVATILGPAHIPVAEAGGAPKYPEPPVLPEQYGVAPAPAPGPAGPQKSTEQLIAAIQTRMGLPPVSPLNLAAAAATPARLNALALTDVTQTVGQRIAQDSARVGAIAQNLVAIQGQINLVQQEALGKVFDIETMQNFVKQHDTAKASNARLRGKVTELQSAVKSIEGLITKAQAEATESSQDHLAKMAKLEAQANEGLASLNTLQNVLAAEQVKAAQMDTQKTDLEKSNTALGEHNLEADKDSKNLLQEKQHFDYDIELHEHELTALEGDLKQQMSYAMCCKKQASELQEKVDKIQGEQIADEKSAIEAQKKSLETQELYARENEALKQRLAKARQNSLTLQNHVNMTAEQILSLTKIGSVELARLRSDLGAVRQRADIMGNKLGQAVEERRLSEKDLDELKKKVEEEKMSSLSEHLSQTQAANVQMKEMLKNMQVSIANSQVKQATASEELALANETLIAQKAKAAQANGDAQAVAREALEKVADVRAKTREMVQKNEEMILKAEASTLRQCSDLWDEMHPDVTHELANVCPQVEEDLKNKKAMVDTLSSSVQSGQA